MPLDDITKSAVKSYVQAHLPNEHWYSEHFKFIADHTLAERLADEFRSARYIYKMLEAIAATDWLLRAQIRTQVLQYASIYEAVVHHILFDLLSGDPLVEEILVFTKLIKISIPEAKLSVLTKHLAHDEKSIIPMYEDERLKDVTKVRFDDKARCAHRLGMIDESMRDDLIEFYEVRNAIHIHAEIRKGLDYQLDLSRRIYRRMSPFRKQVAAFLKTRGL